MSMKHTVKLIEEEIITLQEKIRELDTKGCEHCGYLDSEAITSALLEQGLNNKVREYQEALELLDIDEV
jgi:hypothetical protein